MFLLKSIKHKGFHLISVVSFVFILSACTQAPDCFREDVFCAGLVTDTLGIEDHGINQDTWTGLEEAKANEIVNRIEYIDSIDTRDYQKNITYFTEKGYDVIITTGIGLRDETLHSADLYPDSDFIGINQPYEEVRPNLISVTFREDQIGFAAGVLAASLSESHIVGAVCETSGIESMWRYCEGFRAGVRYSDEAIKIQVVYRENGDREKIFIDETWGFETAQGLIQRGADVIFAAGGATGQGALRATAKSQVIAIGTERDQGLVLAESGSNVATSIFGRASFEVQSAIRLLREGNAYDAGGSQIKYVPFNAKFPESLTREIDILLLALQRGEIKTGVPPEKP